MLPSILLLSLSLLSVSVSALPSPATSPERHSLAILAARGIDPTGPIPSDAVLLPSGGYAFTADSNTSHWVRAHVSTPLSKRALSGLSITLWSDPFCTGSGAFFANVEYGVSLLGPRSDYQGVNYPGRALLNSEQLDVSKTPQGSSDKCGLFLATLHGGTPAGCHQDFKLFSCVRLLKH